MIYIFNVFHFDSISLVSRPDLVGEVVEVTNFLAEFTFGERIVALHGIMSNEVPFLNFLAAAIAENADIITLF